MGYDLNTTVWRLRDLEWSSLYYISNLLKMERDHLIKKIANEASQFISADSHAVYHLQLAYTVVFEEFEGTDYNGILSSIEKIINSIDRAQISLGLINYEGDVLQASRMFNGKFRIIDQWHEEVAVLDRIGLIKFITGTIRISDSRGTQYHYPDAHQDSKPSAEKLDKFIFGQVR